MFDSTPLGDVVTDWLEADPKSKELAEGNPRYLGVLTGFMEIAASLATDDIALLQFCKLEQDTEDRGVIGIAVEPTLTNHMIHCSNPGVGGSLLEVVRFVEASSAKAIMRMGCDYDPRKDLFSGILGQLQGWGLAADTGREKILTMVERTGMFFGMIIQPGGKPLVRICPPEGSGTLRPHGDVPWGLARLTAATVGGRGVPVVHYQPPAGRRSWDTDLAGV